LNCESCCAAPTCNPLVVIRGGGDSCLLGSCAIVRLRYTHNVLPVKVEIGRRGVAYHLLCGGGAVCLTGSSAIVRLRYTRNVLPVKVRIVVANPT